MKLKLYAGVAALTVVSAGYNQQALASCLPTSGFTSKDISMAVGRVVVRPSDAVGAVLRKATFAINPNNSTIYCNFSAGRVRADIVQPLSLSALGNNIYNTNIPGIGIRLYREAETASSFSGYYPYSRNLNANTNYTLSAGYFVVEIIKTAMSTGSGALVPGQYSSYYSIDAPTRPILTSTVYGNAITIVSASCEVAGAINRVVNLAPVSKSGFTGVGTTQGEQTFDIDLRCNGGDNNTSTVEQGLIGVSFDFQPYGTNLEVIENSAPVAQRAGGVGTQLVSMLNAGSNVIAKNELLPLGQVNSGQTVDFKIPMKARYYQASPSVTAGKVRGMATFTIDYQ